MKIIGLCGGSGSGKGVVCKIASELGFRCIDTDAVYHRLTASMTPCLSELVRRFGEEIAPNGSLDRGVLRQVVFCAEDATQRQRDLNKITHKYVIGEVKQIIKELKSNPSVQVVVVDAPMLFESRFDKDCDVTIGVLADENLRIARIMLRDNIGFEDAKRRISMQKKESYLREKCNYIIENNGDFKSLKSSCLDVFKKILN